MGLFSDRITTVVASTVYNLAGDEKEQTDQLRSAVIGSILSNRDNLREVIVDSTIQGPAQGQKRFLRYMEANHPTYLIDGAVNSYADVNAADIQSEITSLLGLTGNDVLRIAAAKIDVGEVDYWAEIWVGQNHPDLTRDDWFVEYDSGSSELVIHLPGPIEARIAASPDLLWAMGTQTGTELRKLLYVAYTVVNTGAQDEQASESSLELLVYRMGTGNAVLDALANTATDMTEFYPALPLRIDNKSVRHGDYSDEYTVAKAAYNRLTSQKLDELLDTIEDNDDLEDIDFAYLVNGISLNTENQVAKEYLYNFLSQLKDTQTSTKADYDSFMDRVVTAEKALREWDRYMERQNAGGPFTNEPPPALDQETATEPPANTFEVSSPALPNLRQRLSWNFMQEEILPGNCQHFDGDLTRDKAKEGEYFIHSAAPYQFYTRHTPRSERMLNYGWYVKDLPRVFLMYQINPFSYKRLEIAGFTHDNFVYRGEAVTITAEEAMADTEASGFIVPLHAPTVDALGMSKRTRMAGSVSHIVFNSYEEVRQRWYEKGIFRVLLVVAAAALSVVIPGLGGATASGILGSNLAVGTALGMTTALGAAMAGAIANAITAVIVTTLISASSNVVFGEKLGALIGSIVSFVTLSYVSTVAQGGTFSWSQFLRADNLLQLTNAGAGAYMRFLHADTLETYAEIGELEDDFTENMEDIEELMASVLGNTGVELDPMELTNAFDGFYESSETFLSRTLLTGSDIVNISHNMISDFSEISLKLPKAFV